MAASWSHVAIEGPSGRILGFVQGFVAGRESEDELFDAETEGCRVETLGERLHEFVTPGIEIHHLIATSGALPIVREAVVRAAGAGLRARIVKERRLTAASFRFELKIFSRERAATVRGWFDRLAPGVELTSGTRFDERVDPNAAGVEAYAPLHPYELRGRGGVYGDVGGVLRLHRTCRADEFVVASDVELEEA